MHRRTSIQLLVAFALATTAVPAAADEIGSTGFSVPQNEWLWGIEGLVRTPVDISADLGVAWVGYEVEARAVHDDTSDNGIINTVSNTLDLEPITLDGGLRFAGGIGYWNCCLLIEPAIMLRWNRAFGDDRTDDTSNVFDPSDADEFAFAEVEYKNGFDVAVGPQITWMVQDSTPLLGQFVGGLPLVFFPYIGVAHTDYDVEFSFRDNGGSDGTFDRNYEDDSIMVGFDLDMPLPGSHWSFTHALTFSFRWTDGTTSDDHNQGPFAPDALPAAALPLAPGGCTGGAAVDAVCFAQDAAEGWRVGLYYRVTWNDFEGFFKRVVFGPVN